MKTITLSDEDAAQARAVLQSYAEMSDMHVNPSMAMLSKMQHDEPGELQMINDLQQQVTDFEEDRDNLRRIADLFK